MAQTTKRADFEAIFPSLAQDILAHAKRYNLPADALEWFENVSAPILDLYCPIEFLTCSSNTIVPQCQRSRWQAEPWPLGPRHRSGSPQAAPER